MEEQYVERRMRVPGYTCLYYPGHIDVITL
jgi:hypothetical protein